jgi:nucleoside-diphosphate-sugar epimerase
MGEQDRSGARLTVLGAGGFVGSALVATARAAGVEVFAPARDDLSWARPDGPPLGHVVYAIGLTADFRTRPLDTMRAHVGLLHDLLAHGRFRSLTYLSSTRVYAGAPATREDTPLRVDPHDASDLYNLSKLAGESLCLHGGRPGCRVARLSNVVGPRREGDTFVDQLLAEAQRDRRVTLQGDPAAGRDYIALADAAALLLRIALAPAAHGIYNVASGEHVTNATVARLVGQALGVPVALPAAGSTAVAAAPIYLRVDTTRVRQAFGFAPTPFARHFASFLFSAGGVAQPAPGPAPTPFAAIGPAAEPAAA